MLVSQGRLAEAVQPFRQVTVLRPDDPSSWFSLGIVLRMDRQWEEAICSFERAATLYPAYSEAHIELGALRRQQGRFADALDSICIALRLRPDSAEFHSNHGAVLIDLGRSAEAEAAYRKAIELKPSAAIFYVNLGDLLVKNNRHQEALEIYAAAINLNPIFARAFVGQGLALAGFNRLDDATAAHQRALQLAPDDVDVLIAAATMLTSRADTANAEKCCRRALDIDPNSSSAWHVLGWSLRSIGRFDEATACFRRSLKLRPTADVYMLLSATQAHADTSETQRLIDLSNQPALRPEDRVSAEFAIAKIYDDADRFEEAFAHYKSANELVKDQLARRGIRFDPDALRVWIDQTVSTYTPDYFRAVTDRGAQSGLPVFIVGMPRSGTTLVEQIAASHSKVHGAGELADMTLLAGQLAVEFPAGNVGSLDSARVAQLADAHKRRLESLGGDAERVIDKMPANILHLGLMATLFPKSRVIFCRRDARDNCLSCYFQRFAKDSLPFSYDLADCAHQYRQQERLYAHWQQALPVQMLTVQYEELVDDLEGQSRRLIDFLGLGWEPACLDFHKTQRQVLTASVWQVRQPIYNRSVGRWKHYEKHLGPLLAALNVSDQTKSC